MHKHILSAAQYGYTAKSLILREEAGGEGGEGGASSDTFKGFNFIDDDDTEGKGDGSEGSESDTEGASDGDGDNGSANSGSGSDGSEGGKEEGQDDDDLDLLGLSTGGEGGGAAAPSLDEAGVGMLANTLGLSEEGKVYKTIDELKGAFDAKLEASRKVVNVDDYGPEASMVINLLENGGSIDQVYVNDKISEANYVLSLDPKEKIVIDRQIQLELAGVSEDEALEKAEAIVGAMDEKTIQSEAEKIDNQARQQRQSEVQRLYDERKAHVDNQKKRTEERIAQEQQSMLSLLEKKTDFLGIPLSDKAKQVLRQSITDGTVERVLKADSADAILDAYLMKTMGKNLMDKINSAIKDSGEESFVKGIKKILGRIPQSSSAQQQRRGGGEGKPFEKFDWM